MLMIYYKRKSQKLMVRKLVSLVQNHKMDKLLLLRARQQPQQASLEQLQQLNRL